MEPKRWPLKFRDINQAQLLLKSKMHKRYPMYANAVTQLAYSLEVYEGRGYDVQNLTTAIECLELAGYEFEPWGPK